MYEYCASVIRVIDGDTLWLRIDLGFRTYTEHSIRLEGVDCPELSTDFGKRAREFLANWLYPGKHVILKTAKDPKQSFNRYVGRVIADGLGVSETMIEKGWVK